MASRQHNPRPSSINEMFDILRNPHRRQILVTLLDQSPDQQEFLFDEFTAEYEDTDSPETVLYHAHLPKLEAAGIIEWDRKTGVVRKSKRFDAIATLIKLIDDNQDELPHDWR